MTTVALEQIKRHLASAYKPDEIPFWLKLPCPQLNGRIPIEMIEQGEVGEVLRVVLAIVWRSRRR